MLDEDTLVAALVEHGLYKDKAEFDAEIATSATKRATPAKWRQSSNQLKHQEATDMCASLRPSKQIHSSGNDIAWVMGLTSILDTCLWAPTTSTSAVSNLMGNLSEAVCDKEKPYVDNLLASVCTSNV